ncbi:MAG: D-alanyl-D-alanine carboxypeptidase [Clostridia bacterium]|nr:D-alanyl-D-alanine carboxypeptidase [Clostridia bacterium]
MFFKKNLVKITAIMLLPLLIISALSFSVLAAGSSGTDTAKTQSADLSLECKSAILMEAGTGRVLYEQNADEALPPASVTKVMTLLLVMEAIEEGKISLEDTVRTSAHAASMGGSQIFWKEGEEMSVEDMVKSVVIASANDAACALAEHISGSEEAFVKRMNERARELGMENTSFENTNGLDDTAVNHLTSARDIAIMSRELIGHEKILEYSSIWMDTVRNGMFGLTNTNRLVRFYRGCTGLKTGSTSKAGFCVSATAERDGVSLICVIMGAESGDKRNAMAARLLDYGFANFGVYQYIPETINDLKVTGGISECVRVEAEGFSAVVEKGKVQRVEYRIELPESVCAPIKQGDRVGEIVFTIDGVEIGRSAILAAEEINKIGFFELWCRILAKFFLK